MAYRLKLVVAITDGLHLVILRISVERRVAAKQKVRDNANSPDINWFAVSCLLEDLWLNYQQVVLQIPLMRN